MDSSPQFQQSREIDKKFDLYLQMYERRKTPLQMRKQTEAPKQQLPNQTTLQQPKQKQEQKVELTLEQRIQKARSSLNLELPQHKQAKPSLNPQTPTQSKYVPPAVNRDVHKQKTVPPKSSDWLNAQLERIHKLGCQQTSKINSSSKYSGAREILLTGYEIYGKQHLRQNHYNQPLKFQFQKNQFGKQKFSAQSFGGEGKQLLSNLERMQQKIKDLVKVVRV